MLILKLQSRHANIQTEIQLSQEDRLTNHVSWEQGVKQEHPRLPPCTRIYISVNLKSLPEREGKSWNMRDDDCRRTSCLKHQLNKPPCIEYHNNQQDLQIFSVVLMNSWIRLPERQDDLSTCRSRETCLPASQKN